MQRYFKRVLAFLTATIMAMSIELPSGMFNGMFSSLSTLVTANAAIPSGNGSESNPFKIGNYSELVWFQQYVDRGNYSVNAILTADITANKNLISNGTYVASNVVYTWTPITRSASDSSKSYSGTFDGKGHTISGLYVNDSNSYNAFIAQTKGTIKNLFITDSYFQGASETYYTSSIVGFGSRGTVIENCGSDAVISGYAQCGGIAGYTSGKIENCYFAGKITASRDTNAIVSQRYNDGTVTNCYYLDTCGKSSSNATSVTSAQLASGEVTYKLNNEVTDGTQVWYQTIGTDKIPKFTGKTVYYSYNSETNKMGYTNAVNTCPHKVYENGICTACGEGQAPRKSEDGVYQLANYGNLVWFQRYVDSGNYTANAILTADITANKSLLNGSGYSAANVKYTWTPITRNGGSEGTYSGTFDGNNHTISGLYLNDGYSYGGALIGYFDGTLKNLYITDSYFGEGGYGISTFVVYGKDSSKIENCGSDSTINGKYYCGGIAGQTFGKIENCYFAGKLISDVDNSSAIASDYYGHGKLTNCYYLDTCGKTSARATAVTSAQLESGEVTYLLNNKVKDGTQAWYQTIGTDKKPKLTGKAVYYIRNSKTQKYEYTNDTSQCSHIKYDDNGFCEGCGTAKEPTAVNGVYQIANRGNWEWVAQKVNSGAKATVNAKLIANIDMGGVTVTKIGLNETNTFTGSFDGGNYTISNFVVNADGSTYDNGLFGYVENGTIKNLNVSSTLNLNANSSGVSNNNHAYSGFVAHLTGNSALIENCNVNTTINIATSGNYNRVGLIASNIENGATVRNCQSSGTIKSTSTKYNLVNCGGIVGRVSNSTIENCVSNVDYNNTINRADDTDISIYNIGGIVGDVAGTNTIKNCTSKGNMAFDSTDADVKQIGGILGYVEESGTLNIENCTNDGNITITSRRSSKTNVVENVGGIIGYAENKKSTSNITSCQNNGAVTVQGDSSSIPSGKEVNVSYVGGIVGRSGSNATLLCCLNAGAVTLTDVIPNQHAGIVGYAGYKSNLKIENCGNTGNITCQTKLTTPNAGNGCTAGILGYINNATNGAFKGINNCFNTGTITSYLNNAASLIGQMNGSITLSTELTNYYLKQSGVNPIGYNSNNLNITSVAKTSAQFESGEVTYLLNNGVTDGTQIWYQTIGKDKSPKFSGKTVYYGYDEKKDELGYINTNTGKGCPHNVYENGFCKVCGETQEPQKSKDGVYQLANYGNLVWFQQYVDSGNYNANAILTADITANENLISNGTYVKANVKYTWTPIAKEDLYESCYSGTFNGNGHTISGLYVNIGGSYRGFMGQFNGTIKNLYITDSYFGGGDLKRATFAGYGYESSKIENCGTDAIVVGGDYSGGIVAQTKGTVENCYFVGKITAGSNSNAIISDSINSYNTGTVKNCYYLDSCGLTSDIATSVTSAQLESGEVTYKLNNGVTNGKQVWYQTIGTDKLPKFSGGTVYYGHTSESSEKIYSNTYTPCVYENGFCKICGKVQEPQKSKNGVYQIANYGNLIWFQQYVDSGNYTANAILTADITANENLISNGTYVKANVKYTWTPIARNGNSGTSYSGTFDGNKHTINGLYVNDENDYGAFIGQFNGTIKNLYITDSYFGGSGSNRATFAGYGYDSAKIENCGTDSIVVGGSNSGGIVGQTKGTLENCCYVGKITAGSNSSAIASDYNNYGTLTNCYYLDSCGLTSDRATAVTSEKFESGEITYILNNGATDGTQIWYQTIGTDKFPKFSGGTVYYVHTSENDKKEYANTYKYCVYENGFCKICGRTQEPQKSEDGVYQLANYGNLVWFQQYVDSGNYNVDAILTADITANENLISDGTYVEANVKYTWTPITRNAKEANQSYSGTFDGNGHTISGLYVNDEGNWEGLIGVSNGTIKNLYITDSYFGETGFLKGTFVGFGFYSSRIENCVSNSIVKATRTCGGLVGGTNGETINSYFIGKITAEERADAVANGGTVTNCYYLVDSCGATSDEATAVTLAQLESGEVTYKLNNGVTNGTQVWYQTIGTDKLPKFSGKTVYYTYNSEIDSMEYSNTNTDKHCPHNVYENGLCKSCGEAQEPQKSEDGVYQLANYGNLVWFQQYVDSGNYNANAILTADITANKNLINDGTYVEANAKYAWTPIAKGSSYSGTFDGNGHTISGLYVNDKGYYSGFMGKFNGTIKNLYITDSYFGGSESNRATFAGYGYKSSKIENCGSDSVVDGFGYTGGIVGETEGTIENCYFAGKITANYYSNAITSDVRSGPVINCYYLDSCGLTSDRATSVTSAQLESGEVAYKLNNGVTNGKQVWHQSIGTDKLPKFSGRTVYYDETASTPYYNVAYDKGDVNNDGVIDKTDVALVLKHISGSKILNDEKANAADYNGDGKINTLDTIEMLKKIG